MDNLVKYALDGLRITNQELFNQRAYELINHYNALNLMTDGVPISVEIIDKEKLINYIKNKYKSRSDIIIKEINIDIDFNIEVKYNYSYIRYYNNKKDADNQSWNNYKEKKDEEYYIPVKITCLEYHCVSKNDIENAGLKIELL